MITVYHFSVGETIRQSGVYVALHAGELVEVGSDRYVRQHSGRFMEQADGRWTECRHEAKRRAAVRVQELADMLARQAESLRLESEREQRAETEGVNAVA